MAKGIVKNSRGQQPLYSWETLYDARAHYGGWMTQAELARREGVTAGCFNTRFAWVQYHAGWRLGEKLGDEHPGWPTNEQLREYIMSDEFEQEWGKLIEERGPQPPEELTLEELAQRITRQLTLAIKRAQKEQQ